MRQEDLLHAMGIRDRPTAPRSPWQNAYVERLIGSIRRDCLDHLIIVDERHLRKLLRDYADYYNRLRTHLSLNKDWAILSLLPILAGVLIMFWITAAFM